ncbi:MAG TPA: DNA-directed RNA polymerase subunit alpha C-terminal domain-containing protein [Pirellulales bacterium]|jgi:DNA-directed RNA polymerase subunit alpha|nr:DNA-directed RNA polymerase subunit alpha C-terminal domain-containing protein [Pirellulales bacterium]
MAQGLQVDLKQLVTSNSTFGPDEVRQLVDALSADFANYRVLREAVQELEAKESPTPASNVRLGLCYYLLGRYRLAIDALSTADGGALAQFYLGKSYFSRQDYQAALEAYQVAAKSGYEPNACVLARAEALRYLGKHQESLAVLDSLSGAVEQTAEYLYQRGATVAAAGGNPTEAVALLERAVEVDPRHSGALFALAVENDRRGNDDVALELYQKSTARFPAHLGALLNLGILYEDRQQYDRARQCYQRILDVYPNNTRARLFFKDAQASGDMFYDEDAQRRRDRLGQVLNIPVTDFELSVRSRNCLQKMGLLTLGDLARTSEQELLASKNFGETSLVEIKEMMASRGLDLGQLAGEKAPVEVGYEPEVMTPDEAALLNKPIADLNLSVRARKCMIRLGISTVGELLRRTGDELLECKNFGVTSLNEVREKLTASGLKLRGD